jgi:cobalt/nickel transport system ATP-binding protein
MTPLQHPGTSPLPGAQACDMAPMAVPAGVPVLQAEDLHYRYHDGTEAVAGVSFSVAPGEAVALCGHNGSGKTTLLKLLSGLLPVTEGSVKVAGIELTPKTSGNVFRTVGLLFQDPQDQLFCNFVGEDVAYGPKNLGLSDAEIKSRCQIALQLTEAQHLDHRPIHHLSGGEMKRVAMAGLVAMRVPVLVLDEPFNGLDPASTERLCRLVRHLNQDHGYAVVTVTHQMGLVPLVADRMLVMQGGTLLADGPVRSLLTDVALMERARLQPPSITKYFYEKARSLGQKPDNLPLTVEEALARA